MPHKMKKKNAIIMIMVEDHFEQRATSGVGTWELYLDFTTYYLGLITTFDIREEQTKSP